MLLRACLGPLSVSLFDNKIASQLDWQCWQPSQAMPGATETPAADKLVVKMETVTSKQLSRD
jgi:hypothetical protein